MAEMKPITDLAREIRDDVEAAAGRIGHQQRPAYYDELSGAGFFFPTENKSNSVSQSKRHDTAPALPALPSANSSKTQQYASRGSGLLFPDSDRRYLSVAELQGMPRAQLRFARNEIFARRGRHFRPSLLTSLNSLGISPTTGATPRPT